MSARIKQLLEDEGWKWSVPEKLPLLWASEHGHDEIVNLLLAEGKADPSYKDSKGKTALIYASENGHTKVVEFLLDHDQHENKNLSHPEYKYAGKNAFMYALDMNKRDTHLDIIKLLLDHDEYMKSDMSNVGHQDSDGKTALMKARHYIIFNFLLQHNIKMNKNLTHPEYTDKDGNTALIHYISMGGHLQVRDLLGHDRKLGKNLSNPGHRNNAGMTALMIGVKGQESKSVYELLNHDEIMKKNLSHPEFTDSDGNTALILAVKTGNYNMVELLLDHDKAMNLSHPEYRNLLGYTALMISTAGRSDILKLLLTQSDSHPEYLHPRGGNLLHVAINQNKLSSVELIINYVDVGYQDPVLGFTPLMVAVGKDYYDITKILLFSGKDICFDCIARDGRGIYQFAKNNKMIKLLNSYKVINRLQKKSIRQLLYKPGSYFYNLAREEAEQVGFSKSRYELHENKDRDDFLERLIKKLRILNEPSTISFIEEYGYSHGIDTEELVEKCDQNLLRCAILIAHRMTTSEIMNFFDSKMYTAFRGTMRKARNLVESSSESTSDDTQVSENPELLLSLQKMTVKDLIKLKRKLKIKGISHIRKADLIDLLRNYYVIVQKELGM